MLNFDDQTYANILARQLDRVTDTIDKRELSIIQTALGPESWYIEGLYLVLAQLQQNSFATFAVGEFLDYKAAERGVYRLPASSAVREAVFNVQVPIGARFSTIDGANSVTFAITATMTTADEYFHYQATCETPGSIGNEYTGTLLPITPVQGLTYAQLTNILIAGSDEEDDESLRARYLLSLEDQIFTGNIAAYQDEILKQAEVGAVQVWPQYPAAGEVVCSILDANFNVASSTLVDLIQTHICPIDPSTSNPTRNGYGFAPIGAMVHIQTATNRTINIEMTLQLTAGIELAAVEDAVKQAIEDYFSSVRREFGNLVVTTEVSYPMFIYASRLTVAILAVDGVVNVTNLLLDGDPADIELVETGATQELPQVGTVTLNV